MTGCKLAVRETRLKFLFPRTGKVKKQLNFRKAHLLWAANQEADPPTLSQLQLINKNPPPIPQSLKTITKAPTALGIEPISQGKER